MVPDRIVTSVVLASALLISSPLNGWASASAEAGGNSAPIIIDMTKGVDKVNGKFIVEVFHENSWQKAGEIEYGKFFLGRALDLSRFVTDGQSALVRLTKQGGGLAHLEALLLGGAPPSEARSDNPLTLKKLSSADNDVADATDGMEVLFPADRKGAMLLVNGRVEPVVIGKEPFKYPEANNFKKIDPNSKFYTYRPGAAKGAFGPKDAPSKVDEMEPMFKVWSTPGSGHPANFTWGWVADDGENLYAVVEFAPDNTMDGEADYSTLYVKTPAGVREFRISEKETKWGSHQFIYSKRADYQHKYYTFKIPFAELGVARDEPLALAFDAYGTAVLTADMVNGIGGVTFDVSNATLPPACGGAVSASLNVIGSNLGCLLTGVATTNLTGGNFSVAPVPSVTLPVIIGSAAPASFILYFDPQITGLSTGQVVLTTNGLNGCLTTLTIPLSGTASTTLNPPSFFGVGSGPGQSFITFLSSVTTNGDSTTVDFIWDPVNNPPTANTIAGNPSPIAGCTNLPSSATINVACGTSVFFQAKAKNANGVVLSQVGIASALPCGPTAVTQPATNITRTSAVLHGTVDDKGFPTIVAFQYGLTTAYGGYVLVNPAQQNGVPTPVSANITGLACGTRYHYRVIAVPPQVARNANPNVPPPPVISGGDKAFTTVACGGGGGGGGGGIPNQPPYFPGGLTWLVSPDNGGWGNGNIPFVWKTLTDLDGDTITYYVYICPGGDFENCEPIIIVVGNGDGNTRAAAALGASGLAFLLVGFGFTRGGRRKALVFIAALALAGSATLMACGKSSGDSASSSGVLVADCLEAEPGTICRSDFTLAPGEYKWKVFADDGRGGQAESDTRDFIVK